MQGSDLVGEPDSDLSQVLGQLGKGADDISAAFGNGGGVSLAAYRLKGVDANTLLTAFVQLLSADEAPTVTDANVGGKAVKKVVTADMTSYVYTKGDVLFTVGTSGDGQRPRSRRRSPSCRSRSPLRRGRTLAARSYNLAMARDPHRPLREAWIVEAVRTPIGRYGGALASVRPDDLAALVLRAVVDRSGIDPSTIEDVILGCANQAGEDNRNVARMAVLLAGLPVEVAGQTVNRLCGSGLQAINAAANAIAVGDGDVFLAGGVESMTRAPFVLGKAESACDRGATNLQDTTLGWRFINPKLSAMHHPYSMGETAENVVERYGGDDDVTRERQDAFALLSHQRAVAAIEGGLFDCPDRAGRGAAEEGRARSWSRATSTRAPTRPWRRSRSSGRRSARAAR